MTKSKASKRRGEIRPGFTLIELVLVLAIAGLILLTVLITVPALRRSQRDAQRKSDFTMLMAALQQFKARNGGRLPYIRNSIKSGDYTYYMLLLKGPNSITNGGFMENENYDYMKSYFEQALVSGVTNEIALADNRPAGSWQFGWIKVEYSQEELSRNTIWVVMGALCTDEEGGEVGDTSIWLNPTRGAGDVAMVRILESGWYMCRNL